MDFLQTYTHRKSMVHVDCMQNLHTLCEDLSKQIAQLFLHAKPATSRFVLRQKSNSPDL
jgi:hypothetical protein